MAWAWRRRQSEAPEAVSPADEIPLCAVGSEVTILAAKTTEPLPEAICATVAAVDGNRIVVLTAAGGSPDEEADVTLQWAVGSGERRVPVAVESTSATTWTLLAVGEVTHQQRRRWARARTALPVALRQLGQQDWRTGETVDVSAGGMAAVFDTLDDGTDAPYFVEILLHLPSGALALTGAVIEVIEAGEGGKVRVDFSDVTETCHDRLAAHVAEIQRQELARRRQMDVE